MNKNKPRKTIKKNYVYTFYSNHLKDYEIENFLKDEIQPSTRKINRSDWKEFGIYNNTITFSTKCSNIRSKKRLMRKLQAKLDEITFYKKYKKYIARK